jgi:hypothetical protein
VAFLANVTVAQAHTLGGYVRVRPLTLKPELSGSSGISVRNENPADVKRPGSSSSSSHRRGAGARAEAPMAPPSQEPGASPRAPLSVAREKKQPAL